MRALRVARARLANGVAAASRRAADLPLMEALRPVLDWAYDRALSGAPGLGGAEALAELYRARHESVERAVAALIARQAGQAGIAGFVTGLGGGAALPVAVPAQFVSALFVQLRLVAAIAYLRGHDLHSDRVKLAVFACVASGAAADRLKSAGIGAGAQLGRHVLARLPGDVLKNFGAFAEMHIAGRLGGHGAAHLSRLVPLLGGLVNGGIDAATTRALGRAADRLFAAPRGGAAPPASPGP